MAARAHPAPTRGTMLPGPATEAIELLHLGKTYGPVVAVDDVSFSVAEGEIFGILGPNGRARPPPSSA
jgi:ABC-type transporter Mla maintaining outer membrane lipid asymmetry ATPase subunit MlaF